jgi:hypothetical protein
MRQDTRLSGPIALRELPRSLAPRSRSLGVVLTLLGTIVSFTILAMALLGSIAPRTGSIDAPGPQRIWVIGSNDPARLTALEHSLCRYETLSRYPDPRCEPPAGS